MDTPSFAVAPERFLARRFAKRLPADVGPDAVAGSPATKKPQQQSRPTIPPCERKLFRGTRGMQQV
jgi:hypothetical protein